MSGGHWDYSRWLHEYAEDHGYHPGNMAQLLAGIERALDWAYSGASCRKCAENAVVAALVQYFDDRGAVSAALAILKDGEQNRCPECAKRAHDTRLAKGTWTPKPDKCPLCKAGVPLSEDIRYHWDGTSASPRCHVWRDRGNPTGTMA